MVETLGSGGMGVVFRAQNIVTGKLVAIKWLYPRDESNHRGSGRPLREARAASCLAHPNVVDVYDILPDGQTWILVMELLLGETLGSFLKRSPGLAVTELIALLLPAMDGVAAAHASGVIHRDLKPDNIFLERGPGSNAVTAKVLDFGIAKRMDDAEQALTVTGKALGTPSYMSLEQLRGDRDIDERADVYALGVVLYEAVTGRMPHDAGSLPELAIKRATVPVPSVKELRPELPSALARIIDWAIARDREQRIPDVCSLRDELAAFAPEHSFRNQMTQPDAVLPLLAAARAGPRSPQDLRTTLATTPAPPPHHAASTSLVVPRRSPGVVERAAWLTLVLALVAFCASMLLRERLSVADASVRPAPAPAPKSPVPERLSAEAIDTRPPMIDAKASVATPDVADRMDRPAHEPVVLAAPAKVAAPEKRVADHARPKKTIEQMLAF